MSAAGGRSALIQINCSAPGGGAWLSGDSAPAFAAGAAGLLNVFIHHGFGIESQNILVYLGYGIDRTTYVGPILGYSAAAAAIVLLARFVALRLHHWASLFAFPALWTGYEYLVYLARGGDAGFSLAYTQLDILPLVQIAAFTGPWGVVFLVMMAPAGLAAAWLLSDRPRQDPWPACQARSVSRTICMTAPSSWTR